MDKVNYADVEAKSGKELFTGSIRFVFESSYAALMVFPRLIVLMANFIIELTVSEDTKAKK